MRIIFCLLLFLCLMAPAALAQDLVIITEENPPYNYCEGGVATGIAVDIFLLAAEKAGLDIDREAIQFWPWARGYQEAQRKPNVILFSTARFEARVPLFQWIGPFVSFKSCIYSLKGAGIRFTGTQTDAETLRIGTVRDSGSEQHLIRKGYNHTLLKRVHSQRLNIKKLMDGRIDAMPAIEGNMFYDIKRMGLSADSFEEVKVLFSTALYFTASRDMDPAIVARLQEALDDLKADGTVSRIIHTYQ